MTVKTIKLLGHIINISRHIFEGILIKVFGQKIPFKVGTFKII